MNLTLQWTSDSKVAVADERLIEVAKAALELPPGSTFEISQTGMLDAFRLLMATDAADHTRIQFQLQRRTYPFNEFGNLIFEGTYPLAQQVPCLSEKILMAQSRKKRAQREAQPVNPTTRFQVR